MRRRHGDDLLVLAGLSSMIRTPIGRTLMTQPGISGLVLQTSTSIGSPSSDSVCGTKP
jgi:hypothetical protein